MPQLAGSMAAEGLRPDVPASASFNAKTMAPPRDSALQQNGGRTPSAWGGFQRRSLFGASVAQRIGKIGVA